MGEDDPVPVTSACPDAVAVTVKDVAAGDSAGKEKDTLAAPLSKALFVPTFVATTLVGASGERKSFCCEDFPPTSFFAIYVNLSFILSLSHSQL
jgi:hypothetical protein